MPRPTIYRNFSVLNFRNIHPWARVTLRHPVLRQPLLPWPRPISPRPPLPYPVTSQPPARTPASATPGFTPELRSAWARASQDAQAEGITLRITSGYRTFNQQQSLWQEAIKKYGDPERAAAWVLPPSRSQHVQGIAVDVDHATAQWLNIHGARYKLCQSYLNEWWHFAYRSDAGRTCPVPQSSALTSSNSNSAQSPEPASSGTKKSRRE
ncbi:M15 family metallopeptidase (plasmid) [Dermacoccus abyssi]|uniref:M15 family metallopeptidase n=1 Tax=Dermacoccus abyssi TaxID=322596 RepID=A0ABX5ZCT7_9MICO|nr:M15 family metallopeptidase [Dermacoccus abyssi]